MANRIKPKRSLTGAKVPDNLEQHELAINVPDKKVYIGGVAGAAILLADYNHAPNPFDQTLNKASSVTFSTVTNGAITLVNVKGDSGQYITSNGDGTTKWTTPSAGQTLVDGNKTLQYGINQDNTIYFPAAAVGANGSAIRTATNEPFSILSYNDTGAGTLYKFQFQNNGITFPDKTTQTTAFVGTATTAAGLSQTLAIASGGTGVTSGTGTGSVVLNTNPTFVTPILGTPQSGNLANCTFPILNQNTTGTASKATTVTTNANLTGIVTSVGNATSIANGAIGNALLANAAVANLSGVNTGDNAVNSLYSGITGNVTHTGDVTDTSGVIKVTKINNVSLAGLTTGILKNTTTTGVPSIAIAADFPVLNQDTTGTAGMLSKGVILPVDNGGTGTNYAVGSGGVVLHINPSFITPILGIPQSGDLKNCTFPIFNQNTTGTASKATTVTTNANLTGIVTSIGNATSIAPGAIGNSLLANAAVANLSGTNSGDNATNTLYSSLVSNVTHTGDATGATALTVVKINGTLLSGLATGILKNTTATGVPSIAIAADFPILNQNTTGTAAGLSTTLSVASGGTGVTASTGTGSVVLNNNPTLIAPILGTPSSGNLANCTFPILNQSTSGKAAGLSATLAVASGGTGLTAVGASGNILTSNGSVWASVAPAGSAFTVSATAPVSPASGDRWYDTSTGSYLVYFNDGTSSQWVETSNSGIVSNPTGTIIPFAGATAPSGFLLCDGSSVSSSNYLALHSVISNTYGGSAYTGAAALSFTLPDYRGRVLIGAGTGSGLTARTLGGTVGTESHTVSSSNISQFSTGNAGSHTHTFSKEVLTYMGSGGNRYDPYPGSVWAGHIAAGLTLDTKPDHSHTVGSASPVAISNMQPSIGVNYLIKT